MVHIKYYDDPWDFIRVTLILIVLFFCNLISTASQISRLITELFEHTSSTLKNIFFN